MIFVLLANSVGQPNNGVAVNITVPMIKTIAAHLGKNVVLIKEIPNKIIPKNQKPPGILNTGFASINSTGFSMS